SRVGRAGNVQRAPHAESASGIAVSEPGVFVTPRMGPERARSGGSRWLPRFPRGRAPHVSLWNLRGHVITFHPPGSTQTMNTTTRHQSQSRRWPLLLQLLAWAWLTIPASA